MVENFNNFVVTDTELLDFVKIGLEGIQNYCADLKPPTIPPFLKVLDSTNQVQILPLDYSKDLNKSAQRRQALVEVGAKFYKKWGSETFPSIVMLTSEAWLKAFDPNNVPEKVRQPSDYPDAIDSIVVQAITIGKPSILENSGKPRASMGALKINRRKPYIEVEVLADPSLFKAGPENTDLLNHFFLGWFQEYVKQRN